MDLRGLKMNTYYERNSQVTSNNDIFEAYFNTETKAKKALDNLLYMLAALLTALSGARVRAIVRAASLVLCLVAFIGIIGAMESGVLGLGMGVLIGCLILGVEFLCLRRQ